MLEWLIEQTLLLSLVAVLLLATRFTIGKQLSALTSYTLWAIVPITLCLSSLINKTVLAPNIRVFTVSLSESSHKLANSVLYSDVAIVVWLLGAVSLLIVLALSWVKFNRNQALTNQPQKEFEVSGKTYQVKTARSHTSPFVIGFMAPTIVLPKSFTEQYSLCQQELILKHEQIHKDRGDLWWNLVAQLLVIAFWFNPLAWLAYKHFRQAQELACDEAVISGKPSSLKAEYANALLCTSVTKEQSLHLIHYGEKSMLKQRLQSVLSHKPTKTWKNIIAVFTLSAVAATATLATAGDHTSKEISGIPLERYEPIYPVEAAENGVEGSVTLKFDIETDGSVSNVIVLDSKPTKVFDKSAKVALRQWLYEKPQSKITDVLVQLDFVLSPSSSELSIKNHKNDKELVLVENHNF